MTNAPKVANVMRFVGPTGARTRNGKPSGIRHLFRALLATVVTVLLLVMACRSESDHAPMLDGVDRLKCVDNDGDGFGPSCKRGTDCDDTDPEVTDQCWRCTKPHPGCTCTVEGQRASCGEVEGIVAGQVICGAGEVVCTNGQWGECIINKAISLLPNGDPKTQVLALGSSSKCADPCDPYCKNWVDTPQNLTDPDAGIVASDAGITLGGSDAAAPVQSACTGGVLGTCSHHVCATGSALAGSCDLTPGPQCVAQGLTCTTTESCCHGLVCTAGVCSVADPGGRTEIYVETFAGDTSDWDTDSEWEIGQATASSGSHFGNHDPANDHTSTSDDKIAGVDIGGFADRSFHGYRWLTSPTIDTSATTGTLTLEFARWLNSDNTNKMNNRVEVYKSGTWTTIWESGSTLIQDSSWVSVALDITAYRGASTKVRFGFNISSNSGLQTVSGWNVDDVVIADTRPANTCAAEGASCASGKSCCQSPQCTNDVCTTPVIPSCVANVCAQRPSCCTSAWDIACVMLVPTACNRECAMTAGAECVLCYKDSTDHDGDGYSYNQGDCKDCDPKVNPGAVDLAASGIDEDCDGTIDNEPKDCDVGLSFSSAEPKDFAKALDLCRFTTAGATGTAKTWGVISASFARADGSACSNSLQRAIMTRFGTNNAPQTGQRMAAFSSGTARDKDDPGYVNPNGQSGNYDANTFVNPPAGFPKNAKNCPNGTAAYDSCGLKLKIRAPTNVASLSYGFNFFTSEYSEWVCTAYNDSYIAIYDSVANPLADKNISFDSNGNPVSVNIGFFSVPSSISQTDHPVLLGTGYDGWCNNNISGATNKTNGVCGGATNWLTTTAPVSPGEEFELLFVIWDTGDHKWDSLVLLDNFKWSPSPATIETLPTPTTPPNELAPGDFVRVYDAGAACELGKEVPVWSLWSWVTVTPSDSNIEFFVSTAETEAALATATEIPLVFSDPPGPSALAGTAAKARASTPDTQNGSAIVDEALAAAGLPTHARFVKIRSRLNPSIDKQSSPTLASWNLDASCRPDF